MSTMQRSSSIPSVPVPSLGSWRQAASVCGFTIDPVLRELGISQHDPHGQLRVSPQNLYKAFTLCVERARGHHFPFALGQNFVFEHYAEFEAFIASSSTIREILELAGWARELLAPWMSLRLDVPETDPRELCHVREVVLAAVNQLILRATRDSHWLLSVRMAMPTPAHHQRFTDHFGVPVFFNEGADALVMDRRWLDMPLNEGVPEARNLALQRIERRPELLREGLEATAAALSLHPRTLQRRLQTEGVKYVDIQSEAKCNRAQVMLRRRAISMESISDELGFSDRRAFTFAFKRWTGMSPSAYRSQIGTVKA